MFSSFRQTEPILKFRLPACLASNPWLCHFGLRDQIYDLNMQRIRQTSKIMMLSDIACLGSDYAGMAAMRRPDESQLYANAVTRQPIL
jgi:hypothetical protein